MNQFSTLLKIYDGIRPVLDIGILTFLLYKVYQIISQTNAVQIIKSAVIVMIAYAVAVIFQLKTMMWIFSTLAPGLVLVFAIVFQPELRKVFLKLGQGRWFTVGSRAKHTYVDSVLIAAEMLSKQKRGMLVCFVRHTKVDNFLETGTKMNADLSSNLLVTIFGHNPPLHDGACFIKGNKILSAGCFLPVSEQYDIKKTFGTRHRAALGLSEVTDCVILIVSEETGAFSLAYDSKLHYDLTSEQVTRILERQLDITPDQQIIEDTIDEHKTITGKAD